MQLIVSAADMVWVVPPLSGWLDPESAQTPVEGKS